MSHLFVMVFFLSYNNNVTALWDSVCFFLYLNMNMNTENREQWQSVATSSPDIAAGFFLSYQPTSHHPCSYCSIYVFHIFLFIYLQTGNDNWFIEEDKGNICSRQTSCNYTQAIQSKVETQTYCFWSPWSNCHQPNMSASLILFLACARHLGAQAWLFYFQCHNTIVMFPLRGMAALAEATNICCVSNMWLSFVPLVDMTSLPMP